MSELHEAVNNGDVQTTQLLIDKGADVNAKDIDGNTPLHTSSERNYRMITKLLIDNGADVLAKNYQGKIPLNYASDIFVSGSYSVENLLKAAMKKQQENIDE